jgi:putative mRNA 3-end processing factor
LITHAHSDHARYGHAGYISTHDTLPLLKHRLGSNINACGYNYGETFFINGVQFSFHAAGHIIGSAQIRVEYKGNVWVVSGDYKREDDGISTAFELVKCHTFITESTFGLPAFNWEDQSLIFNDINAWWQENAAQNKSSIVTAYSLGKAQRILNGLAEIGPVFCHSTIARTNDVLKRQGHALKSYQEIHDTTSSKSLEGAMILCSSAALKAPWASKLKNAAVATASGWMALRSHRKRSGLDKTFVLSDHADWQDLNDTVAETGANQVFVTHGYAAVFSRWLVENGFDARVVKTGYGDGNGDLSSLVGDMD